MKKVKIYCIETEIYDDPKAILERLRKALLRRKNSNNFPFSSISRIGRWSGTKDYFFVLNYKLQGETFGIFIESEKSKLKIRYVEQDEKYTNYVRKVAEKYGIKFKEV